MANVCTPASTATSTTREVQREIPAAELVPETVLAD